MGGHEGADFEGFGEIGVAEELACEDQGTENDSLV